MAMSGLADLRACARQPCFWYGWKAHPYQKHGYG